MHIIIQEDILDYMPLFNEYKCRYNKKKKIQQPLLKHLSQKDISLFLVDHTDILFYPEMHSIDLDCSIQMQKNLTNRYFPKKKLC